MSQADTAAATKRPLRAMSYATLAELPEAALRERIARCFDRMGDFQSGKSWGYRRAEHLRDQAWAELDRRGLPRVAA